MEILGSSFILRPFVFADAESLAAYANHKEISRNLRDGFPHPYTLNDARFFIENIAVMKPNLILTIDINGRASGSIGIHPGSDVYRLNGEIGYWLALEHHNKGIATEAIRLMSEHAFLKMGLQRLFANVFKGNKASMAALKKAGYVREAVHKKAVIKDGVIMDEHVYARYAPEK